MPVPSNRDKILPARGNYSDLLAGVASIADGEICYAIDQDQYYQKEGTTLISVGATKAQGALAATAVQPGDLSTVATSGDYSDLSNKPTLGTAAATDSTAYATAAQGTKADSAVQPGDLATVATSGDYDDLTNKPNLFDGDYDSLTNKPTLGTAAATDSGDYATAAQGALADSATQPGDLATVATSGSYADLSNKPSIPAKTSDITNDSGFITSADIPADAVTSVNGATGIVVLDSDDVGAPSDAEFSTLQGRVTTSEGDITGLQTSLGSKADLVGGVIPTSQLPAIAITEFLGSVGSESAMLALTGQQGDWCLRTDKAVGYVIIGPDPTQASNWEGFTVPGSAVTTVNNQVGTVVLGASDVAAVATSGDNMTGDLTLGTDKVELSAGSGNITAAGQILSGTEPYQGAGVGVKIISGDVVVSRTNATDNVFESYVVGDSLGKINMTAGGSITAAGMIERTNVQPQSVGTNGFRVSYGSDVSGEYTYLGTRFNGANQAFAHYNGSATTVTIGVDGSARFSGALQNTGWTGRGAALGYFLEPGAFNVNSASGTYAIRVYQTNAGSSNPSINLNADGSAQFDGKLTSATTSSSDSSTTVTTKGYVDGLIPSVGNGTITIVQPGTSNQTFTVNQSGNTTITLRNDNTQNTPGNGQINVNAGTGCSVSGSNATANQSGNTTRTISLDTSYTDGRYLRLSGGTITGNLSVNNTLSAGTFNIDALPSLP